MTNRTHCVPRRRTSTMGVGGGIRELFANRLPQMLQRKIVAEVAKRWRFLRQILVRSATIFPTFPSPETRKLVSNPPSGGRAVFKSICDWGYARRAAHELPELGSPGGQRGQRSWHGDTSTQRKQVGSDGMTQTHLLALRACISGSSERKNASQCCPVGLRDLLAGLKGSHTIALPDNTNQSTRVIQRLINCTTSGGRVNENCTPSRSSREGDGIRKLREFL